MALFIEIFEHPETFFQHLPHPETSVFSRLEERQPDFIVLHDQFYKPEIMRGGLTMHQAVEELLHFNFTRRDPNEDTLAYHNALHLLHREFARRLCHAPISFSSISENAPGLHNFFGRLRSYGDIPAAINSPMCLRHADLNDSLDTIKSVETATPADDIRVLLNGLTSALEQAQETGSALVIYLRDSELPFTAPVSRQVLELREAGHTVTEEFINSISIATID